MQQRITSEPLANEDTQASRIFISYRRRDTADVVGRVCDRLVARYGRNSIFLDVDDIPAGVDFPNRINEVLTRSAVVLVAIGPIWLSICDEKGKQRLENPEDHVRVEIERALDVGLPIIPLLMGGNVNMPGPTELPASLRALAHINGLLIRSDPDFDNDIRRLFLELAPFLSNRHTMSEHGTSGRVSARARIEDEVKPIGQKLPDGYSRSFGDEGEEDVTGSEEGGLDIYREGFDVGAIRGLTALRYLGAVIPDVNDHPTPNAPFFAMRFGEVWSIGFADGVDAAHRQIREEPLPFDTWETIRETCLLRRWWTAVPVRKEQK